jgi:predicted HTH transcriptional regulator
MARKNGALTGDIAKLIGKGDNDRLEFRRHSGGPIRLGKIIASFANAAGGKLIIGVDDKGRIDGCEEQEIIETFHKAKEKLIPSPIVSLEFTEIGGKMLAVISIEKAEKIISSNYGVWKRVNNTEEVMEIAEIKSKQLNEVAHEGAAQTIEEMARQIFQLTMTLENTISLYNEKNRLSRKVLEWTACGVIGVFLTILYSFFAR